MGGKVEIIGVGYSITEFEAMLREKINGALKEDRGALKALECSPLPPTPEELEFTPEGFLHVKGFLALDDSGDGRAFEFVMELGLKPETDREIAEQCAQQAKRCLKQMKKNAKNARH